MSDRNLLVLSYSFPPSQDPEAQLIAKRLAYLSGWKAHVVTAQPDFVQSQQESFTAIAEAAVASVTRIIPFRLPWHRLGLMGCVPDGMRWSNRRMIKAAHRLEPRAHRAMLSWSQWHSSHLAALTIKGRHPSIPWLAHFSDPWVDNPFVSAGGIGGAINRRLERRVVERADRVLFTTPETVDLVMSKYPSSWRDKVRVIPHGYDPRLYSGERPVTTKGRRLVARYLGNFYGIRTPEPLYRSLTVALQRRPSLPTELKIEIVGRLDEMSQAIVKQFPLPEGLVTVRPPVGYAESLRLMETADFLLLIDAPAKLSVFLPSKLVDYLGAGRPIAAFVPPGASARTLMEVGYEDGVHFADPLDIEACANVLITAMESISCGNAGQFVSRERYSAEATAAILSSVLDEMVER